MTKKKNVASIDVKKSKTKGSFELLQDITDLGYSFDFSCDKGTILDIYVKKGEPKKLYFKSLLEK